MDENERMQAMADGIILACSHFISDTVVSADDVISVSDRTGITQQEWNVYHDEISKKNILEILKGRLKCAEDEYE